MRARSTLHLGALLLALACGARAQDAFRPEPPQPAGNTALQAAVSPATAPPRIELDSTSIRGNQELPKVMYIVPWKDPAMAELAGRPVNSLVEEVIAPVDREVFRRQGRYFQQLYGAGTVTGQSP